MGDYDLQLLGTRHLAYLAGTGVWWLVVVLWGKWSRSPDTRRSLVWGLVAVSLGQEVAWAVVAAGNGTWQLAEHLPLHLCSFALLLSVFALATRRQFAFELAYFWALVGATQALLTPDASRWAMGELDAFWNFLSHGVVILNVLWLVFVEGTRVRRGAWLRVFAATNAVALAVGVIDWISGYNYLFLREKPGVDNPFLVGEWPVYLLVLQGVAFLAFYLLEQPMRWASAREEVPAGAVAPEGAGP